MWELFSALLGFGTSAYNAQAQAEENQKNREWNEKMIAEAREWDLAQWNRQNQYNSPQQQMQRFSEAGLNPNLIYGQGNPGNAGTLSTSAPSGNQVAPQLDLSPALQAAQLANSIKQTNSNIDLQATQSAVMRQQAVTESLKQATEIARAKGIDASTKGQIIANTLASAIQPEQIDQARLATDIARWQRSISRLSAAEKEINVKRILPLEALRIEIANQATQAGIRLNEAQISKLAVDTQNALIQGKVMTLQYEYDKVLREYGVSPDTNGFFKTAVHPFTWQRTIKPFFKELGEYWEQAFGGFSNPSVGTPPTLQLQPANSSRRSVNAGISNNIRF